MTAIQILLGQLTQLESFLSKTDHTPRVSQDTDIGYSSMAKSPDHNPIGHAFQLLMTKLNAKRPTNKQELRTAAVKDWQSNSREETQYLLMCLVSTLQAIIDSKGLL